MTDAVNELGIPTPSSGATTPADPAPRQAAVVAPGVDHWTAQLDESTRGWAQSIGLATSDLPSAISAIRQRAEAAEKAASIPADKALRLPEPDDVNGWRELRIKLGAPADAKDYDFSKIEGAPDALRELVRGVAGAHQLHPSAAEAALKAFSDYQSGEAARALETKKAEIAKSKEALDQLWKENALVNKEIARRGAVACGVSPEVVQALESVAGYDKVMEFFRQLGVKTGEAKYVGAGGGGPEALMTPPEAQARLAQLQRDPAWTNNYVNGGAQERAQAGELMRIIAQGRIPARK